MNPDQAHRRVQELTMEMRNRGDHGQFATPSPMSAEDPKDPVDNQCSTGKDDDTSQVDNHLLHRRRVASMGCREGDLLFQQHPVRDDRSELIRYTAPILILYSLFRYHREVVLGSRDQWGSYQVEGFLR